MYLKQSDDEAMKSRWLKYRGDCQAEEGASEEDMAPFLKQQKLVTYKTTCVLACLNDKIEFVRFIHLFICLRYPLFVFW